MLQHFLHAIWNQSQACQVLILLFSIVLFNYLVFWP
jgi:hypothetical protein